VLQSRTKTPGATVPSAAACGAVGVRHIPYDRMR